MNLAYNEINLWVNELHIQCGPKVSTQKVYLQQIKCLFQLNNRFNKREDHIKGIGYVPLGCHKILTTGFSKHTKYKYLMLPYVLTTV